MLTLSKVLDQYAIYTCSINSDAGLTAYIKSAVIKVCISEMNTYLYYKMLIPVMNSQLKCFLLKILHAMQTTKIMKACGMWRGRYDEQ